MDGFETLERLMRIPAFRSRALCLAVTAHADDATRERCLEVGFNGFLPSSSTPPSSAPPWRNSGAVGDPSRRALPPKRK